MELSSFLHLIGIALITWRVSNMLIYDYGIFHIFLRLRYKLGVHYEEVSTDSPYWAETYVTYEEFKPLIYENKDKYTQPVKTTHLSEIFTCIYCMSVWLSPLFVLLFIGFNHQFIFNALFVMGMVILIEEKSK